MAVGGTGIASLVFFTIRHFVLKISKDITTVQTDAGQRELITGLREEVARLEALVDKMQGTIEKHTAALAVLENKLLRNRSNAVAALALVEAFECGCNEGMRTRLIAILHKMADVEDQL